MKNIIKLSKEEGNMTSFATDIVHGDIAALLLYELSEPPTPIEVEEAIADKGQTKDELILEVSKYNINTVFEDLSNSPDHHVEAAMESFQERNASRSFLDDARHLLAYTLYEDVKKEYEDAVKAARQVYAQELRNHIALLDFIDGKLDDMEAYAKKRKAHVKRALKKAREASAQERGANIKLQKEWIQ